MIKKGKKTIKLNIYPLQSVHLKSKKVYFTIYEIEWSTIKFLQICPCVNHVMNTCELIGKWGEHTFNLKINSQKVLLQISKHTSIQIHLEHQSPSFGKSNPQWARQVHLAIPADQMNVVWWQIRSVLVDIWRPHGITNKIKRFIWVSAHIAQCRYMYIRACNIDW